jgi:hypothetical protein
MRAKRAKKLKKAKNKILTKIDGRNDNYSAK